MTSRLAALLCLFMTPLVCGAEPAQKPRVDSNGVPLPEGVLGCLGGPRFAASPGYGVALSPNGRLVATGSCPNPESGGGQNRLLVWDADAAKPAYAGEAFDAQRGHEPAALTYSEYGRLVAGVDSKTNCQVWNLPTRKLLWRDKERRQEIDANHVVTAFRFIDDDKFLAIAYKQWGFGSKPEVELRDAGTGKRTAVWTVDKAKQDAVGSGYHFCHVALSPSGTRMAWLAGTQLYAKNMDTCVVLVCETATGKLLHTLSVKGLPWTRRVDLPDEGETLVLIPYQVGPVQKIKPLPATVVNVSDGRTKFTVPYRFRPAPGPAVPYGVSPQDALHAIDRTAVKFRDSLLTFDEVGLTRWEWKTGKKLEEYNEPFSSFAVSRDGERIAVREGPCLGLSDGKLASLSPGPAYSRPPFVRFLGDGRLVGFEPPIIADGMLHVWQPRSRQCLQSMRLFAFPREAFLDRFDTWGKTLVYKRLDGTKGFATFDLTTNQRMASAAIRGDYHYQLSGDGKRVLAALHDKNRLIAVRWFDAETTRDLGRYEVPGDVRADLVQWFADDGSKFGYVTTDNQLALVDCATKKLVRTIGQTGDKKEVPLEYQSAGFHRLIWSQPARKPGEDPRRAVVGHALYDHQGRLLRRLAVATEVHPGQLLVSPDARTLAVCIPNQEILFFETITNKQRGRIAFPMPFLAHLPTHHRADFSPDGTLLATSHANGIWLWDMARPLNGKPAWPVAKEPKDVEHLWELLGDPDPAQADRALWALAASGAHALQFIKKHLNVGGPLGLDAKRLQELIAQLDDTSFAVRAAAEKELDRARLTDLPALHAARKAAQSLEQSRRLDGVIARVEARQDPASPTRPWLRDLRALQVLERIGGTDARKIVHDLAVGSEGLRGYEAQFTLARWR